MVRVTHSLDVDFEKKLSEGGETKFVGCNLREETKYGFATQS